MGFSNPGNEFISQFGPVRDSGDVLRYAAFLRDSAGLSAEPPIDLEAIYSCFDIPLPESTHLPNLQGLLFDPEKGIILINQSDPPARQRFSEAHELMELLFAAIPPGGGWNARMRSGAFRNETKERVCNEGAAELLLPRKSLFSRLQQTELSFDVARQIAAEYHVSTTAALVQMVRVSPGRHAVVLWRMKYKPTESRNQLSPNQLSMFADFEAPSPKKRLRVEWVLASSEMPYIPVDKSISEESSIYEAWRESRFTAGQDELDLSTIRGVFSCESQPFQTENERQVLSLISMSPSH